MRGPFLCALLALGSAGCAQNLSRQPIADGAPFAVLAANRDVEVRAVDGEATSVGWLILKRLPPGRHTLTVASVFYENPSPIVVGNRNLGLVSFDAVAGRTYRAAVDAKTNTLRVDEVE